MFDAPISVAALLGAIALLHYVTTRSCRAIGTHFLFLTFFGTTVLFLQVSPIAAQVFDSLDGARQFSSQYSELELGALVLFQLPLVALYFAAPVRSGEGRRQIHIRENRTRLFSQGLLAFALLWFAVVAAFNLWNRRTGDIVLKSTRLPLPAFFIYRSFIETFLFLLAIGLIAMQLTPRHTRLWIQMRWTLTVTAALSLPVGLINSRSFSVFALVIASAAVLWFRFGNAPVGSKIRVALFRIILVIYVLVVATLGIRSRLADVERSSPTSAINVVGDEQGLNRFNGIDLIARLKDTIDRRGPAWGEAWYGATWNVRRFVDPAGFDRFRLKEQTTAKNYLMRRYLNWTRTDYYSCFLTDLYGNFSWFGFLAAAMLLGGVFRFCARQFARPTSAVAFLLALKLGTSAIIFEQEAATFLFGWVLQIPIVTAVLVLSPFRVQRDRSRRQIASEAQPYPMIRPTRGGPHGTRGEGSEAGRRAFPLLAHPDLPN